MPNREEIIATIKLFMERMQGNPKDKAKIFMEMIGYINKLRSGVK